MRSVLAFAGLAMLTHGVYAHPTPMSSEQAPMPTSTTDSPSMTITSMVLVPYSTTIISESAATTSVATSNTQASATAASTGTTAQALPPAKNSLPSQKPEWKDYEKPKTTKNDPALLRNYQADGFQVYQRHWPVLRLHKGPYTNERLPDFPAYNYLSPQNATRIRAAVSNAREHFPWKRGMWKNVTGDVTFDEESEDKLTYCYAQAHSLWNGTARDPIVYCDWENGYSIRINNLRNDNIRIHCEVALNIAEELADNIVQQVYIGAEDFGIGCYPKYSSSSYQRRNETDYLPYQRNELPPGRLWEPVATSFWSKDDSWAIQIAYEPEHCGFNNYWQALGQNGGLNLQYPVKEIMGPKGHLLLPTDQ
ncbi:hypothetical protein ABW19_dt0210266 [Dactylella cylindrospora]|nr:hypothetical protein ABW19_dt0210266 [Dactylella cylindrospora]